MKNNLFISDIFSNIWLEHNNYKKVFEFDFVDKLKFVKLKLLPVYTNVGVHQTQGVVYIPKKNDSIEGRRKLCKIMDVPSYFQTDSFSCSKNENLKVEKIKQHPGYLARLDGYDNLDAFMKARFTTKTRGKFRSYIRRLEYSFDISYKVYFGSISIEKFNFICNHFYRLLKLRFEEKGERIVLLNPKNWKYFCKLAYGLITNKEGFFFVIYDGEIPINISFNFCSKYSIQGYSTVFDIAYSKFSLGHISFIKISEWGIKNKILTYDFSKVEFEYKKRWCEIMYDFEVHLFYDSKSLISIFFKSIYAYKYKALKYLRDKKIDRKWQKFLFYLRYKKTRIRSDYFVEKVNRISLHDYTKIQLNEILWGSDMRKAINDFLYTYKVKFEELNLYVNENQSNKFMLEGNKNAVKIVLRKNKNG